MKFTCIKCEFKFYDNEMDVDERMCYDCIDEEEVQDNEWEMGTDEEALREMDIKKRPKSMITCIGYRGSD